MLRRILPLVVMIYSQCGQKAQNVFSFCRDFNPAGCIGPQKDRLNFSLQKSVRDKTIRDFANSLYFRGDRVAFEIQNARAKRDVTFECLHGHYFFGDGATQRHELEYIELRDKNVYGLVMLGSLIEKKYESSKLSPYKALSPFEVTYTVRCGKDLLAEGKISVDLE